MNILIKEPKKFKNIEIFEPVIWECDYDDPDYICVKKGGFFNKPYLQIDKYTQAAVYIDNGGFVQAWDKADVYKLENTGERAKLFFINTDFKEFIIAKPLDGMQIKYKNTYVVNGENRVLYFFPKLMYRLMVMVQINNKKLFWEYFEKFCPLDIYSSNGFNAKVRDLIDDRGFVMNCLSEIGISEIDIEQSGGMLFNINKLNEIGAKKREAFDLSKYGLVITKMEFLQFIDTSGVLDEARKLNEELNEEQKTVIMNDLLRSEKAKDYMLDSQKLDNLQKRANIDKTVTEK